MIWNPERDRYQLGAKVVHQSECGPVWIALRNVIIVTPSTGYVCLQLRKCLKYLRFVLILGNAATDSETAKEFSMLAENLDPSQPAAWAPKKALA